MAAFGTASWVGSGARFAYGVALALALAACSGDDDDAAGSMAGTTAGQSGTSGGVGGGGSGGESGSGGGAGDCDERACVVSKEVFQAAALNCPDDYDAATREFQEQPGEECTYAFFDCGGLKGAAYQYGFTGDNVQCYYDGEGELVGGYRSSDHHAGTTFGEVPEPRCYTGPVCDDAGVPDGGSDTEHRACQVNSDCAVSPLICCPCGELAPSDVIGVNKDQQRAFYQALCADNAGCPPVVCEIPPARYVASCVSGQCEAIDLQDHPATECEQAIDCRVRSTACCECGASTGPGELVAITDSGAFEALVCDPEQGCPECEAMYPSEIVVSCMPGNHCGLVDPREQL